MSIMRPGEFDITDRGIELAGLGKGSRVLDIGCGQGDTLNHLVNDLAMAGEGIDMSLSMISGAREKYPGIKFELGDGEFLDNYSSFTFDGVLMECVLSLINIPDEALHEAYCVLKKGGKLIISDVYEPEPGEDKLKAVKMEAERLAKRPRKEGECEERSERFVDFRLKGAFFKEPLISQLEEIGYRVVAFEDRSGDLDDYIAQTLMDEGSLDGLITNVDMNEICMKGGRPEKRRLGYFLLVAEKPLGRQ